MNDDWDGVDWAEHFSGPDDDEIERRQAEACCSERANDREEPADDAPADAAYEATFSEIDAGLTELPLTSYDFGFDTVDDLNIFTRHARQIGAKNLKVTRHEPFEEWYIQDNSDDENVKNFKLFTVKLDAAPHTNFSFYRSGLRYQFNEKTEIIELYLGWTHVDQIAATFRRTPTAICALLQKEGYFFRAKVYADPDYGSDGECVASYEGYRAGAMLNISIETGICAFPLASFLGLECASQTSLIYIRDISETDKAKLISFAACSVSIDTAKILARKLHQWNLLYFLALQSRDLPLGLEALNFDITNLNESLSIVRFELRSYLRSCASKVVSSALLNWSVRKEIRYKPAHPATTQFIAHLDDVHFYYQLSSPTSGFSTPDTWKVLLALLSCDFDTLERLAVEGSLPAKWFCCDRAIAAMNSGGAYRCDSDWARETRSLILDDDALFDMLHECLPYNSEDANRFASRIRSQAELDALAQNALRLECEESSYQSHLDDQAYADHDYD